MTSAHDISPPAAAEHGRQTDQVRSSGYRLTAQRELVLAAINRLGHATPEQCAAEVRRTAGAVTLSTVRRSLELLEQLGLVYHTHLGHDRSPTYHASAGEHVHLICDTCGRITDVGTGVLGQAIATLAAVHKFQVDVRHLAIFGRCAHCRPGSSSRQAGPIPLRDRRTRPAT